MCLMYNLICYCITLTLVDQYFDYFELVLLWFILVGSIFCIWRLMASRLFRQPSILLAHNIICISHSVELLLFTVNKNQLD
jgi:uncharacterized membrane protein YqjE